MWKYPLPETQWNSDSAVYVKLADYGICQQYTLQGVRGAEGTPPYLPPEVVIHCGQQSHSTKLDIYSFGMLMYYLFTFENPFYDDPTRPVSSLLEEGKRPSLSIKVRTVFFLSSTVFGCDVYAFCIQYTLAAMSPHTWTAGIDVLVLE